MRAVDLIIEGYEDPVLEGENITFSCHDGLTLIGPNSSTCMNGEWEPDPKEVYCTITITELVTTGASTVTLCMFKSKIIELFVLSTRDYSPLFVFTINMFIFTSATCSSPLYVLQIKDPQSVSIVSDGSLRSELNKTPVCCSGFLITKPNTTTCLENGEWELETSQMKDDG